MRNLESIELPALEKYTKLIIRLAFKSGHKWAKHAALVLKGGAVVATGFNHEWNHAEVSALQKLWPNKRRGTTVWSIRLTRTGRLAEAKPCPACDQFLRENGVKAVVYSTQDGRIERMKL